MKRSSSPTLKVILAFSVPLLAVACGMTAAATGNLDGVVDGGLDGSVVDARSRDGDAAGAEPDAAEGGDAGIDSAAPPPLVVRLNIGGDAYDGLDYPGAWAASPVPGVCTPNRYRSASPIHGTRDTALFEAEVFGDPVECAVGGQKLAQGTYRVRLYFAEIYFGEGCPGGGGVGSRVFDIVIENVTTLKDFDILAAGGDCLASTTYQAGAPVVRSFDVFVGDGTLDIALPASENNAKLSALEVFGPL